MMLANTEMTAVDPDAHEKQTLVRLRNLKVEFVKRGTSISAVNGVDLDLHSGEVLCLLGESGSGKSVLLRSLMRLNPAAVTRVQGNIEVCGVDIGKAKPRDLQRIRSSQVAMIFQEPMTALDPVFTIGRQIGETIRQHEGIGAVAAEARALELLERVQIPSARQRLNAYPHELSGGLRQRAMIAIALSCNPKLLLADEPTTALDATVQIQILVLLRQLQEEMGMGVVFVTHDLGVAGEISDRIAVMYAGRIVEQGTVSEVMRSPLHPYTQGLLGATVHAGLRGQRLTTIAGSPPDLSRLPPGCAFAPRCSRVEDACTAAVPPMYPFGPGQFARCIKIEERSARYA